MKSLSLTLLAITLSASAFATRLEQRQQNQGERIDQGQQSGVLNPSEYKRLHAGQEHLNRVEGRVSADGISKREAYRMEKIQDRQNRKIRRLKNNNR